jgi:arylsulfatase A-like enzyme
MPNLAALRAGGFGPGDPRFEDLVARYDAEIAATDAALRELFRGLADLGVRDRSLVVITADHGEEFLEHGYVEHGWTLYEEVLRVPLLFWAPGALAPARVRARASHVDVVPSLLDLLGITRDGPKLDGLALFEMGPEGMRPVSRERVQIAELLIPRRQIVRAVLLDDWKYVAAQTWIDPADRSGDDARPAGAVPDLWAPPVREELYHLGDDPGEARDRIGGEADVRRELAAVLARFRDTGPNYGFAAAGAEGGQAADAVSREDTERLRALGYRE